MKIKIKCTKLAKSVWWWIFGLGLFVIVAFVFIHIFYPCSGISWSDWLLFAGGFLSFVGTVVLAMVSVKQNDTLKQQNDVLMKENRRKFQLSNQDNVPILEYVHQSFSKEEITDPKGRLAVVCIPEYSFRPLLVVDEDSEGQRIELPTYHIIIKSKAISDSGRCFKETYRFALKNISNAKINSIFIYDIATRDSFCSELSQMRWNNKQLDDAITNELMLKNDIVHFIIIIYHDNEYEFDKHRNDGVLSLCVKNTTVTGYQNYQIMTHYLGVYKYPKSGEIVKRVSDISEEKLSALPPLLRETATP